MPLNILPEGDGTPNEARAEYLLKYVREMLNADPDRISIGDLDEAGKKLPVDSERFGLYVDDVFQANIIRIPQIDNTWGAFFSIESLQTELRERLRGLKMDDVEVKELL